MKGILFKPDMIRAIVEGRKMQTRRVVKPQPLESYFPASDFIKRLKAIPKWTVKVPDKDDPEFVHVLPAPRYQVGQVVYIKEALFRHPYLDEAGYVLDNSPVFINQTIGDMFKWRWVRDTLSPMLLPQEAARYFIKITGVRAERLQEITFNDIEAEGHKPFIYPTGEHELGAAESYRWYEDLWDSINKDYQWESNPWVWRYQFELKKGG